jgi:hypothetical protein
VAKVQRPRRIGADKFQIDIHARKGGARAEFLTLGDDLPDYLARGRSAEGDVDEPRAGDFNACNLIQGLQAPLQKFGYLAGRASRFFGHLECNRRGIVAMIAILGPLQPNLAWNLACELALGDHIGQGSLDLRC